MYSMQLALSLLPSLGWCEGAEALGACRTPFVGSEKSQSGRRRTTNMLHAPSSLLMLLALPATHSLSLSVTRAAGVSMTVAAAGSTAVSVEDTASIFGRLADAEHVFTEPIRTAASGFEFSSNTAIKPKWLIGYVSRDPCGEDVDLPTHCTRWSTLLFPDGAQVCSRASFDAALGAAEYVAPLGIPKWSVPGKELVDAKACAAPPSAAALEAAWLLLGGGDGELACECVVARLCEMATSDDLNEAVLFSDFRKAVEEASASASSFSATAGA